MTHFRLTPTLNLPPPGACLRPWRLSDAAALTRHANDRGIWQNLRDTFPHPYTAADAAYYLALVANSPSDLHLAFEVDGEAVGSIGVFFKDDVHRRSAEVGYWLSRAHWGRGLATAAVRSVAAYVFAHFDICRLYAIPFETNPASARVLEKAGFELEATMRKSVVKDGQMLDSRLYALVV